jgi:hypothetical protein
MARAWRIAAAAAWRKASERRINSRLLIFDGFRLLSTGIIMIAAA